MHDAGGRKRAVCEGWGRRLRRGLLGTAPQPRQIRTTSHPALRPDGRGGAGGRVGSKSCAGTQNGCATDKPALFNKSTHGAASPTPSDALRTHAVREAPLKGGGRRCAVGGAPAGLRRSDVCIEGKQEPRGLRDVVERRPEERSPSALVLLRQRKGSTQRGAVGTQRGLAEGDQTGSGG